MGISQGHLAREVFVRIVIGGPPHSGKSVFLTALAPLLGGPMPIRAAPDGEGNWTQKLYKSDPDLAKSLRRKGSFSNAFVNWAAESVRNCDDRFCLVDIGGRISDENRRICKHADALIILAGDAEKIQEWLDFAAELKLRVLAVVHSKLTELDPTATEWVKVGEVFEGQAVDLIRETFINSTTIEVLASWLIETIPQKKEVEEAMNTLTTSQIASLIGKQEEDYVIRGAQGSRTVHGLNWQPAEIPAVEKALKPFSALGTPWLVDGIMPQWMAACVTHSLHPCVVSLTDTKVVGGSVQISQRKSPQGAGSGELTWEVVKHDDHTLVKYGSTDPIRAEGLDTLIPPQVPGAKPVYLWGRTSTWGAVDIAMVYAHIVQAVYIFQPGVGYVCAISHSRNHKIGTVVVE